MGERVEITQEFVHKWGTALSFSVAAAWLHVPYAIQILLMLMALDVLSGLIAAARTRTLSSSIMMGGLLEKIALLPVLTMLHLVEAPLKLSFELEAVAAYALMVVEAMSIVENAARAGAPIPTVIVDALVKAKIHTSTAAEIERQFSAADETNLSVRQSSSIIKTPDSVPDLKVEKTVTVLEEQHITPVSTEPTPKGEPT